MLRLAVWLMLLVVEFTGILLALAAAGAAGLEVPRMRQRAARMAVIILAVVAAVMAGDMRRGHQHQDKAAQAS